MSEDLLLQDFAFLMLIQRFFILSPQIDDDHTHLYATVIFMSLFITTSLVLMITYRLWRRRYVGFIQNSIFFGFLIFPNRLARQILTFFAGFWKCEGKYDSILKLTSISTGRATFCLHFRILSVLLFNIFFSFRVDKRGIFIAEYWLQEYKNSRLRVN